MASIKNFIKKIRGKAEEPSGMLTVDDMLLSALLHGDTITRDMALSIPRVSSSVRKICDTVSMVSFKLYRTSTDSSGKHTVNEVFDDSRLRMVNFDTGDTMDAFQFKHALVEDYLMGQGGYAYINRSGNAIMSLHYVKENRLSFYANQDPIFKSYSINLNGKRYLDHDFYKILRNTRNGYSGKGVMDEIAKALEAAYSALLYTLKLTKAGGMQKGFLQSEKKLDKAALAELKDAWKRMYTQDTESAIVLNNGVKFQGASQTTTDMQLNQIRNALNNDISDAFGMEKDDADFLKYTITPILTAIEISLNRYLLLEKEKDTMYWKADTRELDKMDALKRYTALTTAIRGGLMGINEARYRENMREVEGLDLMAMSLGTTFFDMNTGNFYTPNTGLTGSASGTGTGKGGEN